MSVVVRMEMPKNCFECPFSIIDETGVWCNGITKNVYGYVERDEDCPIVCQLPEGHGRLVDADAAVKDIRDEIFECKMDGLKGTPMPTEHLWLMENWIADEDICPTIVPAERSET